MLIVDFGIRVLTACDQESAHGSWCARFSNASLRVQLNQDVIFEGRTLSNTGSAPGISPRRMSVCKLLVCKMVARSVLPISIRWISNWGSRIPETLLVFTSKCPLKVQISQGLGPFSQIELLRTVCTTSITCEKPKPDQPDLFYCFCLYFMLFFVCYYLLLFDLSNCLIV